jgi:cyclophilin family peptidyl-prolyl cis-trans isomerase
MKLLLALTSAFFLSSLVTHAQEATPPPSAEDAATKAVKAAQESEELQKIANKALEAAGEKAKPLADKVKQVTPLPTKPKAKAATPAPAPDPKNDPSKWDKDSIHKLAVMEVEYGGEKESIVFHLLEDVAPAHVSNFIENCTNKAYNGLAIHRAIDGYLVQTGDPLTADQSKRNDWGTGGEEKSVPAETKGKHRIGTVAMARRSDKVNPSRASNGFQFYFALGNMSSLDGSYSVFGQVVSGLETLEAISRTPADSNDCPLARIEVRSIKVVDQKGPLVVMRETGNQGRRFTKPASAKSGWERMLERIW